MNKQEAIEKVRTFLRSEGIQFFRRVKTEFGTVAAVIPPNHELNELPIPWPIHFREGMQIRNFLRQITDNGWEFDEYENGWVNIVNEAIKEPQPHAKA